MLKNHCSVVFLKKKFSTANYCLKNSCRGCGIFFSLYNEKRDVLENTNQYYTFELNCNVFLIFYVFKNTFVYYISQSSKALYLLTVITTRSFFFIEKCFTKHLTLFLKFSVINNLFNMICYQKLIKNIFLISFFHLRSNLKNLQKVKEILRKNNIFFKQIVVFFNIN